MAKIIGIRREDKNEWERRTPLVPSDMSVLVNEHDIGFKLQPFPKRSYSRDEYEAVGATFDESLGNCSVIFGIKEMPDDFFREGLTYCFFAHVIKGQDYNMPMLTKLLKKKCTLIDYERIVDDRGFRLVFFGNEAGLAGMLDTLWMLGRKLDNSGIGNPFSAANYALDYENLQNAEGLLRGIGKEISENGLPDELHPVVVGFAGYGNVSRGAQQVLDFLPVKKITPEELLNPPEGLFKSKNHVYKVVFKEEDMVEPVDSSKPFELQDYYDNPENYQGVFEKYVPRLTVLMNCIYWTPDYPRLVTRKLIEKIYSEPNPKLQAIGDISIDVEGAIEISVKATDSGNPVYVYDVEKNEAIDGVEGNGPVILAVDNLPCELPREASASFSEKLVRFIPSIANADFSVEYDNLKLPPPLKRAVICHQGRLTPDYEYLSENL